MSTEPAGDHFARRFALSRTGPATWALIDLSVTASDEHHLVARIREEEESGVTVEWALPLPLPVGYLTPQSVLEDLSLWNTRRQGWSRPVPIPHHPPLGGE